MIVDQVVTDFGRRAIDLVWSLFLDFNRGKLYDVPLDPSNSDLFHPSVPDQLAAASFAGAASAGGYLPNDTYYYGIAPVGDIGEGAIRLLSTGYTADNTNGTVDLTISLPADLDEPPTVPDAPIPGAPDEPDPNDTGFAEVPTDSE